MELRQAGWWIVQATIVVVVLALIAGQVLGQPLLFSFVTTDSMAGTIDPGDGFVALPPELAGELGEGDVVTFEAEEIQGGGLTTHRIVGETERGFVTRGDNNPFTDQDGGEPPVQRTEIAAVAWQPGGSVVTIPGLGTAVTAVQSGLETLQFRLAQLLGTRALLGVEGLAYLLLGLSILLYLLDVALAGDRDRDRTRSRDTGTSSRRLVAGLALLIVAGATAAMVGPAGAETFGIVSAEFDSDAPDVIRQGTTETIPYRVTNGGLAPTTVYLSPASDGVAVDSERLGLAGRSSTNVSVSLTAPPETGFYQLYLEQHRYIEVLPVPVIDALYQYHPWLPIVVIDAVLGLPFYLLGVRVIGTGRLRGRDSDGPGRLARLRTRLRRFVG